ncbi:MurR/RpiR family transcriptional regulator [Micromonospora sp. CPCC 206061]|uniref:MurR/RpiR family transcriptional regulator n=1 Tax=Micromonospora sp. CPCC 206061 TaxID=3122410 RepID=UPI002FEF46E7
MSLAHYAARFPSLMLFVGVGDGQGPALHHPAFLTIELATAAAGAGASVVLLTDQYLSPIADIAEAVLPARVDAPSPFDSLVPAMALVESLVAGVSDKLGDAARKRFRQLEDLRPDPDESITSS